MPRSHRHLVLNSFVCPNSIIKLTLNEATKPEISIHMVAEWQLYLMWHGCDMSPVPGQTSPWSDTPLVRHPPGQTPPPWTDTPSVGRHSSPWADIPGQIPPQVDTPQADTSPGRRHHPLPGRHPHQIATAAESTKFYPTGMDSCFSTKNLHRIYLLMKDIKFGCTLHRHITISSAHKWNLQQSFHFSKQWAEITNVI